MASVRWQRLVPALVLAMSTGTVSAADQRQVLVLHSTRRDAGFSLLADRELPLALGEGRGLDYYSEYIDLPRFAEPGYRNSFRDFLRVKYAAQRFDVVLAMFDSAIEFLRTYRDVLFPDTPIVFLANRAPAPLPNATGVISESRFADTVAFAAKLQPDLRQVFVVTGASGRDREYEAEARAQFERAKLPFRFTYLSGFPGRQLEATLGTLPAHSMVYMVVFYQDADGHNVHPLEYTDHVSAVASAPTYSWLDSLMDHGIVGGSLLSERAEVDALAGVALRLRPGAGAATASDRDVAARRRDRFLARRDSDAGAGRRAESLSRRPGSAAERLQARQTHPRGDDPHHRGRRALAREPRTREPRCSQTSMTGPFDGGMACWCLLRRDTTSATQPVQVGSMSTIGRNSTTKVGSRSG